jgi:hypothetical protein
MNKSLGLSPLSPLGLSQIHLDLMKCSRSTMDIFQKIERTYSFFHLGRIIEYMNKIVEIALSVMHNAFIPRDNQKIHLSCAREFVYKLDICISIACLNYFPSNEKRIYLSYIQPLDKDDSIHTIDLLSHIMDKESFTYI